MCCKTILGARARNIDSRTATNTQHRSKNSFPTIRLLRASCLSPSFATEPPQKRTFHSSSDKNHENIAARSGRGIRVILAAARTEQGRTALARTQASADRDLG